MAWAASNTPLTVTNRRYFQAPTVVNQPSYDIDYNWLVTKSVADPKSVNVPQGTDASFDYEVRLEALDASTSGFGGTVTVTNPNALDMVATLSAEITGGAGCTVVDADILDVSPNAGLQVNLDNGANVFTYTCPAASLPGGTTATAAWNQAVYPSSDPAETYTRSDAKAFVIDQKVDETTTVTDTFNGGAPQDLGTFNWNTVRASNDPAAHTVVVATYQRDIAGVPGTCTDYPNTARESADDTSDSETVTVCVGANLNVTKDANLGYQRELLWDIAKSGPGTVFVGEDARGQPEDDGGLHHRRHRRRHVRLGLGAHGLDLHRQPERVAGHRRRHRHRRGRHEDDRVHHRRRQPGRGAGERGRPRGHLRLPRSGAG